ncbi:MAG TPA: glycosyltransferase [Thermoleophilaceae bacterium]|nr:glycosyltransferase [Thermoleophilaceae bacterium]
MTRAVLWSSLALLLYTHAGYPALLWLLLRLRREHDADPRDAIRMEPPSVSLIVAAHDEAGVIAGRVANARALDYPRDRLDVIVASDGSTDGTIERARAAGADRVLELPRGGKVAAQDAAVELAHGELLAFSDANSAWAPDALRHLVARFADPRVGYVCGQVGFLGRGSNQEGVYWRYENAVRALESRLAGITAGNGAIYAVRRSAYLHLDPRTSHDLSFPFSMVKRGWRAVYEPAARAEERMAPTVEGEFRRKRRMMRHAWPTVLAGGLLSPRGYPRLYALEVASHRALRYTSPALHLALLMASAALAARRDRLGRAALAAQVAVLAAAGAAPVVPARPLRLARYYVLVTGALAAGLWDHLREGTPTSWEREPGTR